MVADDLGDKRQAEPLAGRFRRHEGIEQMRQDIVLDAGSGIVHAHFERQRDALRRSRHANPDSRPEGGLEDDLALRSTLRIRLGGILGQIEEHLHQLIAVALGKGSEGS